MCCLVIEVNIVFTLMGKGLAFDPLQQIGQYVIDYLSAQESAKRKHALVFQIIHALAHQLLPGNAVELVQGIAVEIN
jgi:hypothetical protein